MSQATARTLQRFTPTNPCPVCGGQPGLPRGLGVRCVGFRTGDGFIHCTREERAGSLMPTSAAVPTFAHVDRDDCRCGLAHDQYDVLRVPIRNPGSHENQAPSSTIVAAYDYTDSAGGLLYQVVRYTPKAFKQRRPNGHGGWVWDLKGVERVPYRLPELLAADPVLPIYVLEGEKDADRLASLGLIATTNAGGAGQWTDALSEYLRGREHVVIVSDFDDAGRHHERLTYGSLRHVVDDVRIVDLPDLREGGDISDWLDDGHTLDELRRLAASAARSGSDTADLPASQPERLVSLPKGSSRPWPAPPDQEAFHGLAGEIVATLREHTEADDVALLASLLAALGCAIGPGPYVEVGEARHGVSLFAVTVGDTSRARKGHAWESIRRLAVTADTTLEKVIVTGLSTGEGLIERIRDDVEVREWNRKTKTFDTRIEPGADDKRLLAIETEMARLLEVIRRDGNTLSAVLRQAWDGGGALHVLTRRSPLSATGGHVVILGHITADELRRRLDDVSIANGLANRFLWLCVRRARLLSRPEPVGDGDRARLVARMVEVVARARECGRVPLDDEARAAWDAAYPGLTADRRGLAGAMTARAEAHALRLSLLYALLDGATVIRPAHVVAALALVEYAERSVEYLFGGRLGDPVADTILDAVRRAGRLSRVQVSNLFSRHASSSRVDSAVAELVASGSVTISEMRTGGRPATVLEAVSMP